MSLSLRPSSSQLGVPSLPLVVADTAADAMLALEEVRNGVAALNAMAARAGSRMEGVDPLVPGGEKDVFLKRDQPQVGGVDAPRVLAFVVNDHASGDCSAMDLVRDAMREGIARPVAAVDDAVPPATLLGDTSRSPFPALRIGTLRDLSPEAFLEGGFRLCSHNWKQY